MTDYARQTAPQTWEAVRGAFTVKSGGRSVVLVDPDLPNGPTREVTYDLNFPANWLDDISTAAERAMFGIREILAADSPPEGVETDGFEIIDHNGEPKYRAIPLTAG